MLELRDLPVIDQPDWPKPGAKATPAFMDFRITWTATEADASFEDAPKHLRFTGRGARAMLEASVRVPSTGFTWRSDPAESSSAAFGVFGEEVNGRYFSAR